jgi:hypothetical protein
MERSGGLSIAAMIVCLAAPVLYAGAGSDAAAFLKIDAGARAGAMGGAFTAVAEDALSIFYNPAGPALAERDQAALAHAEWLEGLRNEHMAYVHVVSDRVSLFTGFSALLTPRLDEYDDAGFNTGTFSAMDGAAGAGIAWKGEENLSLGLFAKTVYQQARREKAYAYAGDIGALYDYREDVRFGAAIQNLGTAMRLYRESFDLPRTYRTGAAYRLKQTAWFTAEILKAGRSDTAFALGAEGEYAVTGRETVFLRAGYKSGRSKNAGSGVSAGLGIRTGDLGVDYAFSPFGDLGDAHRFTLTFRFGKSREITAPAAEVKRPSAVRKIPAKKTRRSTVNVKRPAPRPKNDNPIYFTW